MEHNLGPLLIKSPETSPPPERPLFAKAKKKPDAPRPERAKVSEPAPKGNAEQPPAPEAAEPKEARHARRMARGMGWLRGDRRETVPPRPDAPIASVARATPEMPVTADIPQPSAEALQFTEIERAHVPETPLALPEREVEARVADATRRMGERVVQYATILIENERARSVMAADPEDRPVPTSGMHEALGDLDEAIGELTTAIHSAEQSSDSPSQAQESGPGSDRQGPEGADNGSDSIAFELGVSRPLIMDRIAERVSTQLAERRRRLEAAEDPEARTAASAAATLGVLAVGIGAWGVWRQRKLGKEVRASRRDARKLADEQRKMASQITTERLQAAQQQAELQQEQRRMAEFQRVQADGLSRQERQQHYRQVSEFTHHQADTVRGVAHSLEQRTQKPVERTPSRPQIVAPAEQPALVRGPEAGALPMNPEQTTMPRQERTGASPAEQLQPLSRVERADTFERGPDDASVSDGQQAAGGRAEDTTLQHARSTLLQDVEQNKGVSSDTDTKLPGGMANSPATWIAGVLLAAGMGVVVAIVIASS